MIRAICCVPVSPLRAESSHRTEMTTQLIFGECCEILEQAKEWSRVRVRYDGYEGWCTSTHLEKMHETDYEPGVTSPPPEGVSPLKYNGHPMMVPMGSHLTEIKKGRAHGRKNPFHYKGKPWAPADA